MIVHEHSPRIPGTAAILKKEWKEQLARRNGTIPVSPHERFDKVFTNIAKMCLEHDIDPARYVAVAMDVAINTTHCYPTMLASDAVQRKFMEISMHGTAPSTRAMHFTAEFAKCDALIKLGKTPMAIASGSYDFGPLILWVLFTSFKLDASPYRAEAREELNRNPEANEVFGEVLKGLK